MVKRSGGIVALAPVTEGIKNVQIGVDKTVAELAIQRLRGEIKQLKDRILSINSDALCCDLPPYNQLGLTQKINGKWNSFRVHTLSVEAIEGELAHKRELAIRPPLLTNRHRYEKVGQELERLVRIRREVEQQIVVKEAELKKHEEIINQ